MTTKKKLPPVKFTSEATTVINIDGDELGSIYKDGSEIVFEPYGSAITKEELIAITEEVVARSQKA